MGEMLKRSDPRYQVRGPLRQWVEVGELPPEVKKGIERAKNEPKAIIGYDAERRRFYPIWERFPRLKEVPILLFQYRELFPICCPECGGHSYNHDGSPRFCSKCGGGRVVCPMCEGSRHLIDRTPGSDLAVLGCVGCGVEMSDGWEYSPEREEDTIREWIDLHIERVLEEAIQRVFPEMVWEVDEEIEVAPAQVEEEEEEEIEVPF
jgi:hypothetical protein